MTEIKPTCVIAFFGIDRRLDITAPSIIENIIRPAQEHFQVKLMAHLWSVTSIDNDRSGEKGKLAAPRLSLLPEGEYKIEPPIERAGHPDFQTLCEFGDFWGDGFKSLFNLYSQLVSLTRVTNMALEEKPDYVIFVRPDLLYHDSFEPSLKVVKESEATSIIGLPNWQPHGGFNDRFAICKGRSATEAYGKRLACVLEFCNVSSAPLHSEKLLKYAVTQSNIKVKKISARASRIRIDGRSQVEDFSFYGWKLYLRAWLGKLKLK